MGDDTTRYKGKGLDQITNKYKIEYKIPWIRIEAN